MRERRVLIYDAQGKPTVYDSDTNGDDHKHEIIQSAGTSPNSVSSAQPQPKPDNNWYKSADWWMVILTGILAVFAIFAFIQTRKQAKAALSQLEAMKAQMILDQRAWISIKEPRINFTPDGGFYASVVISNTGKTPAINVRHKMDLISPFKEDIEPTNIDNFIPIGEESRAGILGPGSTTTGVTTPPTHGPHQSLYIGGRIWYDDVFGQHHWVSFFYKALPDGKILRTGAADSCDDVNTNH